MPPFPDYVPRQTQLGPLEAEIMELVWQLGSPTVRDVHEQILSDPDRELAYASVTTVLHRLAKKGWLVRRKQGRAFCWQPRVSKADMQIVRAQRQLKQFLALSNPDIVAAFADTLDAASLAQLDAINQQIQAARHQQEQP
ncbi:MAG: CopY family transcriptional regulator [Leptolyngbya sp. SIO4C1]|nr:CopY family transcriptional regulator [Leptolyngbya sp. SIO4C1]